MGNTNSTRKVTVPNDDPAGVIKVSEAVVQRLKGTSEEVPRQKSPVDVRSNIQSSAPIVYPPQYSMAGSLTALQIQQAKEEELRKNDEYWMQRLQRQQETHKAMDFHMQQQYDSAVSDVKGSLFACPDPNDEVPCRNLKDKVTECYKNNPKAVLKCSQEVLAFQACVDIKRMEKIENRA
ncbi:hypothetical protein R5R35_011515 [Gryllus longicercus]|uniref:Uncharacterized protein n=1 Tax=Gryllus longicercus TaxID=2509291 RepID=A0AAN9YWI6_9ORTH